MSAIIAIIWALLIEVAYVFDVLDAMHGRKKRGRRMK
jgi:hypothetical protein